jgi:hypothetical protein
MSLPESKPDISIHGLATSVARFCDEILVAKMQLPALRQVSETKKKIEDMKQLQNVRRSEARELRKNQGAAEAKQTTVDVDVDGDLVIATALTVMELQKTRFELFARLHLYAIASMPSRLRAEADAIVDGWAAEGKAIMDQRQAAAEGTLAKAKAQRLRTGFA